MIQVLYREANSKAISFDPYLSTVGGKNSYPVSLYEFNPFNASVYSPSIKKSLLSLRNNAGKGTLFPCFEVAMVT